MFGKVLVYNSTNCKKGSTRCKILIRLKMKFWITDIYFKKQLSKAETGATLLFSFQRPASLAPVVFQQVSAANVDDLFANRSAQVSGEGGRRPTALVSYWSRAGRSGQAERESPEKKF
jgi:hypothetical protein